MYIYNKNVTGNAIVFTGIQWCIINRNYCIKVGLIVSHHQHQNESEGFGDKCKSQSRFNNTPHAPLYYWCYATSFLYTTRTFLSHSTLGTGLNLFGST